MSRNQADDIKRQRAQREREISRRQVQRVMRLDPAVWVLLDTLIDDTGLPVNDLLGESLAIAAVALREKHKPKTRGFDGEPSELLARVPDDADDPREDNCADEDGSQK